MTAPRLGRADGSEILAAAYRTIERLTRSPAELARRSRSLAELLEGVVYPDVEHTSDRLLAAVATDRVLHQRLQDQLANGLEARSSAGLADAVTSLVEHNLLGLLPALRAETGTGALDALGDAIRAHRARPRPAGQLPISYVLPLKASTIDEDLLRYVDGLRHCVGEVIVVDGSPDAVFDQHAARWGGDVHHLRPEVHVPNGKVANVLTALRHAAFETIVLADDDVRWSPDDLAVAAAALDDADVIRPHNRFDPAPWHARWDTARTLINRTFGGDWPGTLVFRRSMLADGYAGDVLFENLELVRTVQAAGGREQVLFDLVVRRRPPSARKFAQQRVRQAYDEWARPSRLVAQLLLAPLLVLGRRRVAWRLALASVCVAELGRRRGGGVRHWPASAALWAPAWVLERSVTSWLALVWRSRGGVRFGDARLRAAANRHPAGIRRQVSPSSPRGTCVGRHETVGRPVGQGTGPHFSARGTSHGDEESPI